MSGRDFSITNDQIGTSASIKQMEWCPTMDLLAILTTDNAIFIHRFLTWQRLFSVSGDDSSNVFTTMTWRPDGKVLVAGSSNGTLTFVDIENGQTTHTIKVHQYPISSLHWHKSSEPSHSSKSYLPPANIAATLATTIQYNNTADSNHPFEVVLCGDESGHLSLHAYGKFCIGFIDLRKASSRHFLNSPTILKAHLSEDLRCISVISQNRENSTSSNNNSENIVLLRYDSGILHQRKRELTEISTESIYLTSALDFIQQTAQDVQRKWNEVIQQVHKKWKAFDQILENEGVDDGDLPEQLHELLVTGFASSGLRQFLLNTINETQVKKFKKQIDMVATELEVTILKEVQKRAQALVLILTHLNTLSCWKESFEAVGLDSSLTSEALRWSGALVIKAEKLIQAFHRARINYSMFFNWLVKAQTKLSDDGGAPRPPPNPPLPFDSVAVSKFIQHELMEDSVNAFFLDKDMPNERLDAKWQNNMPFPVVPQKSLTQILNLVRQSIEAILSHPQQALSQAISFISVTPLYSAPQNINPHFAFHFQKTEEGNSQLVAFHPPSTAPSVWFLKYNLSDEEAKAPLTEWNLAALPMDSSETELLDFAFYKDSTIATLTKQESNQTCLALVSFASLDFTPFQLPNVIKSKMQNPLINAMSKTMILSSAETVVPEESRIFKKKAASLAVSPGRGTASICSQGRKLVLLDLEAEDEDQQQEEEGEQPEEEEEDHFEEPEIHVETNSVNQSQDLNASNISHNEASSVNNPQDDSSMSIEFI